MLFLDTVNPAEKQGSLITEKHFCDVERACLPMTHAPMLVIDAGILGDGAQWLRDPRGRPMEQLRHPVPALNRLAGRRENWEPLQTLRIETEPGGGHLPCLAFNRWKSIKI